jgi:hypothetical protein
MPAVTPTPTGGKQPQVFGPVAPAELMFQIHTGLLTGTAGGEDVKIHAFSGGRGGSTTKGAVDKSLVNNPDMVSQKEDDDNDIHGGPLPPGEYAIGTPVHRKKLGLSAALTPAATNKMYHRGGFYIHGSGPHGSEGCIVPSTGAQFQRLMHLLTLSHGGELTVVR